MPLEIFGDGAHLYAIPCATLLPRDLLGLLDSAVTNLLTCTRGPVEGGNELTSTIRSLHPLELRITVREHTTPNSYAFQLRVAKRAQGARARI